MKSKKRHIICRRATIRSIRREQAVQLEKEGVTSQAWKAHMNKPEWRLRLKN